MLSCSFGIHPKIVWQCYSTDDLASLAQHLVCWYHEDCGTNFLLSVWHIAVKLGMHDNCRCINFTFFMQLSSTIISFQPLGHFCSVLKAFNHLWKSGIILTYLLTKLIFQYFMFMLSDAKTPLCIQAATAMKLKHPPNYDRKVSFYIFTLLWW